MGRTLKGRTAVPVPQALALAAVLGTLLLAAVWVSAWVGSAAARAQVCSLPMRACVGAAGQGLMQHPPAVAPLHAGARQRGPAGARQRGPSWRQQSANGERPLENSWRVFRSPGRRRWRRRRRPNRWPAPGWLRRRGGCSCPQGGGCAGKVQGGSGLGPLGGRHQHPRARGRLPGPHKGGGGDLWGGCVFDPPHTQHLSLHTTAAHSGCRRAFAHPCLPANLLCILGSWLGVEAGRVASCCMLGCAPPSPRGHPPT